MMGARATERARVLASRLFEINRQPTSMPSTTLTRSVAVQSAFERESDSCGAHDELSGSLNSKTLSIHAEIIVLVRPAVPLPVQPHPLVALLVGVVDQPRGFFGAHAFPLHR